MQLSERLQDLRKRNNDSQEKLAEKLGVSRQAVSKWESGQGNPDINNIIKISGLYNVSTDYLLLGASIEESPKKKMDPTIKKALFILIIMLGVVVSGVLFLTLLTFFTRLVI
ncbi:MAG: helix-turn-helix domain-containing protein [Lachnospiraceae bacterium]